MNKQSYKGITAGVCVLFATAAMSLAGCQNKQSAAGVNPGATPASVTQAAQQNANAQAAWIRSHPGHQGPPGSPN